MNPMEKNPPLPGRPLSVSVVAALLLAIGLAGIMRPFASGHPHYPLSAEDFWVLALSAVAVVCGALLLKRRSWARWLSLAWIAIHVGISFLNSLQEVTMHTILLLLIAYLLFRSDANSWFRSAKERQFQSESAPAGSSE